jgi:hypothetical protein
MKSDRTITKRVKLSKRYAVDMTLCLGGGFVCEWQPSVPMRLSKSELQAYREGRNALVAEYAAETGEKVLLIEA